MLEVQKATLDMAGASRLEQIRAGMSGGAGGPQAVSGSQAAGALGEGTSSVRQPDAPPVGEPVQQPDQRA